MAVYVPKYDGYIIDNPNIDFERCDGTVYSFDKVNTASIANTSNQVTITGGQGRSPLAYIDSDMTSEITFASSEFTMDMFEMANATLIETGDYGTREGDLFDVDSELKVTLPFEVKAGSVKLVRPRGLEEATTLAAGKYTVTITASAAATAGNTVVAFNTGDVAVGDTVRVSYIRRIVNGDRMNVTTNNRTAKGALWLHIPVYSSGESCVDSAIKGVVHIHYPRVRATALPGFDTSYKGASTNSVTFSAIDARRADKKWYDETFEPYVDGEIVNKSEATTVDWN